MEQLQSGALCPGSPVASEDSRLFRVATQWAWKGFNSRNKALRYFLQRSLHLCRRGKRDITSFAFISNWHYEQRAFGLTAKTREYLSGQKPSESPMKICFIIHNVTARAGSERVKPVLRLFRSRRVDLIWSTQWRGKVSGFFLSSIKGELRRRMPLPYFLDYPWLACVFAVHVIRQRPDWIGVHGSEPIDYRIIGSLCARRKDSYSGALSSYQ